MCKAYIKASKLEIKEVITLTSGSGVFYKSLEDLN